MKLADARTIAATVFLLVAVSVPVHGADDCAEWKQTYAAYEDEV